MSAHTPGPWIWGEKYYGLYGAGTDNEVLCHAYGEGMWLPDYQATGKANALLIAAAPDLLDAVHELRRELDACQHVIHLAGGFDPAYVMGALLAIELAGKAIAKATGEPA